MVSIGNVRHQCTVDLARWIESSSAKVENSEHDTELVMSQGRLRLGHKGDGVVGLNL